MLVLERRGKRRKIQLIAKYIPYHRGYYLIQYKVTSIRIHLNMFKYTQIRSNTLKYANVPFQFETLSTRGIDLFLHGTHILEPCKGQKVVL